MHIKKCKILNIFDLIIFFGLALLCFLAPLKFSLPFIEGMSRIYPHSLAEWLFFPWPFEFAELLILFLFATWIIKILVTGQVTIRRTFLDKYHLLFVLVVVLASIFSINSYRSLNFLLQISAVLVVFYLMLYNLNESKLWSYLFAGIVVNCVVICLYGLYQYGYGLEQTRQWVFNSRLGGNIFPDAFLQRLSGNRVFSTFVYPNSLAGYIVLIFPLCLSVFFIKPYTLRYRLLFYVILTSFSFMFLFLVFSQKMDFVLVGLLFIFVFPLLNFIVLGLTLSKGGALTFFCLISCFVYFYFKKGKYKKYKRTIFALYLAIVILLSLFVLKGKLGGEINSRIKAPTLKVRLDYWRSAAMMLGKQPFLGTGPNTFGILYSQYKLAGSEDTQMVHNNYLQIGVETGVVGLILFCMLWGESVVRILGYFSTHLFTLFKEKTDRLRNKKIFCLSAGFAVLAFSLHSFVDFDLYIPSLALYAWIFLSVFVGYSGTYSEHILTFRKKRWLRLFAVLLAVGLFLFGFGFLKKEMRADYLFEVGKDQWKKKDIAAVKTIKLALELNPKASPYWFYLSHIYAAENNLLAAIACCQQAIKQSKYTAYYYNYLGKLYYVLETKKDSKLREYDNRVVSSLQTAITYSPTNVEYKTALAKYFEELGDFSTAIREYKKALILSPNDAIIKQKIEQLEKSKKLILK